MPFYEKQNGLSFVKYNKLWYNKRIVKRNDQTHSIILVVIKWRNDMKQYIALLRGINISGKNKIAMPELKLAFEAIGMIDVVTYINSGNVIFSTECQDEKELIIKIESIIAETFLLDIPVTVVSVELLSDIFKHSPDWWNTGDKKRYDTLIFVISPTSVEEVIREVGEAKPEYETVSPYDNVIFWSASLDHFSKTRWSKVASSSMNNHVTMRTANTVKKLLEIASRQI